MRKMKNNMILRHLRLSMLMFLSLAIVGMTTSTVSAIPALQLDIGGGTYFSVENDPVHDVDTIIAPLGSNTFTLYALLDPSGDGGSASPNDTYYISAAISPKLILGTDLGYFYFAGERINVTDDMTYGNPPLHDDTGADRDPGDLQKHGIFETYYTEFSFQFDTVNNTTTAYNSQDDPGTAAEVGVVSGEAFYFAEFDVDVSGLDSNYIIHFDLYNSVIADAKKNGSVIDDSDIGVKAPFSHDAESRPSVPVPEPATILLLGSSLFGFIVKKRKNTNK